MKPAATVPSDKRAFGRRETSIKANVRDGHRLYDCTIRDLSEGGALIELASKAELSNRFWIRWDDLSSEIVCEIRHRNGNRVGVQFARPIVIKNRAAPAASTDLIAPQRGLVPAGNERAKAALASLAARQKMTDALQKEAAQRAAAAKEVVPLKAPAAEPPKAAAAKAEPAKIEPVKAEPVKAQPVKAEPVKAAPAVAPAVAARPAAAPVASAPTPAPAPAPALPSAVPAAAAVARPVPAPAPVAQVRVPVQPAAAKPVEIKAESKPVEIPTIETPHVAAEAVPMPLAASAFFVAFEIAEEPAPAAALADLATKHAAHETAEAASEAEETPEAAPDPEAEEELEQEISAGQLLNLIETEEENFDFSFPEASAFDRAARAKASANEILALVESVAVLSHRNPGMGSVAAPRPAAPKFFDVEATKDATQVAAQAAAKTEGAPASDAAK